MQSVPQPSPDVQGTTLDGETVLLDLRSGPLLHAQSCGDGYLGTLYRHSVSPRHSRHALCAVRSFVGTDCRRSARSGDASGSRGTLNIGKEVKTHGTAAEGILYRTSGDRRMNCCATSLGTSMWRPRGRREIRGRECDLVLLLRSWVGRSARIGQPKNIDEIDGVVQPDGGCNGNSDGNARVSVRFHGVELRLSYILSGLYGASPEIPPPFSGRGSSWGHHA